MLKGLRPELAGDLKYLQDDLDERQRKVDRGEAGQHPWQSFINEENKRTKEGQKRLSAVLSEAFHGKCAYCESVPVAGIDHVWPKAPSKANGGLGTPAKMFRWDNMLPSCSTCNGPAWKGTKLQVGAGGRPLLLEPTLEDPIHYLEVVITPPSGSTLELGWIDAHSDLTDDAQERANYTLKTLGLNLRDELRRGRARVIRIFSHLFHMLRKFGPDFLCPPPMRIRDQLCALLDPSEPYLSPIRQVLRATPSIRIELVDQIPELEPLLNRWDRPLTDSRVRRGSKEENGGENSSGRSQ